MTRAHAAMLADGRRLHLQDGPIDLVIEAFGSAEAVRAAYAAAMRRFDGLLDELCAELPALRAPARPEGTTLTGPVAKRMYEAVAPHAVGGGQPSAVPHSVVIPGLVPGTHSSPGPPTSHVPDCCMGSRHKAGNDFGEGGAERQGDASGAARHPGSSPRPPLLPPAAGEGEATATPFITPMAAVAGSVADEILAAMLGAVAAGGESDGPEPGGRLSRSPPTHSPLTRAYVNNGGDVAVFLAPGERFRIGLVDRPDRPTLDASSLFARTEIGAEDTIAGIATSGWRGRSFSLGIADAVTVLAATAAAADAAATVIANAVDLPGHPAIARVPARDLAPDSDLGDRLVTRGVGALTGEDIDTALTAGVAVAEALVQRGLIAGAALHLAGATRVVGIRLAGAVTGAGIAAPLAAVGPAGVGVSAGRPQQPGGAADETGRRRAYQAAAAVSSI